MGKKRQQQVTGLTQEERIKKAEDLKARIKAEMFDRLVNRRLVRYQAPVIIGNPNTLIVPPNEKGKN